jgi:hypothetical protein
MKKDVTWRPTRIVNPRSERVARRSTVAPIHTNLGQAEWHVKDNIGGTGNSTSFPHNPHSVTSTRNHFMAVSSRTTPRTLLASAIAPRIVTGLTTHSLRPSVPDSTCQCFRSFCWGEYQSQKLNLKKWSYTLMLSLSCRDFLGTNDLI